MYTVYNGYDNTFTVQLLEDDVAEDLSAVTKVELIYKGTTYDSDTSPTAFDYSTGAATGLITFQLGGLSLTEGRDSRAELIVYDATNDDGIFWGYVSLKVMALS